MAKIASGAAYDRKYQHDFGCAPDWKERRNVWLPHAIMLAVEMMEMGIDPEWGRRIAHETDFVLSQMVDGVPPNKI